MGGGTSKLHIPLQVQSLSGKIFIPDVDVCNRKSSFSYGNWRLELGRVIATSLFLYLVIQM